MYESDTNDLVSIVITSYNRAPFISKAIESCLQQDYQNIEIVISDNCSSDETSQIVEKYLHDSRVKFIVNEYNIGMIGNFLRATTSLARGKFICFVSSDDFLINPSFISEAVSIFSKNENISVVGGINITYIQHQDKFETDISYKYYKDSYYRDRTVNGLKVFLEFPQCPSISYGGAVMDRSKLLQLTTEYPPISFDLQNILQLLLVGNVGFIDKPSYLFRKHDDNASHTVKKAETYISNLLFIDRVYQFALISNKIESTILDNWKLEMYKLYSREMMLYFYKHNRLEYYKFNEFLSINHPQIEHLIKSSKIWKWKSLIYAYKPVGYTYEILTKKLVKVKHFVSSLMGNKYWHSIETELSSKNGL
jgi:glycosyltransferase involved in cell wall biosynthesis